MSPNNFNNKNSRANNSRESSFNNRYQHSTATTMNNGGLFHEGQYVPQRVHTKYTYGNGDHYEGEVLAERRDIRDGQGIFYCSNKQKRTNYEYHGEWR